MAPMQVKSIGECSLQELTELWNTGFQEYDDNMSKTTFQMIVRMGRSHIHPDLSVAFYEDGQPVGFVLIGWKVVHGRKLAWNAGTGVSPAFRGRGLSKQLLTEAISRVKNAGAASLSLETRTNNEPAIRAYRSCGFQVLDTLKVLERRTDFERMPFPLLRGGQYHAIRGLPELASRLPFYPGDKISWSTQWFKAENGQSLIVYDDRGSAAGYGIFMETLDETGRLSHIRLLQCEADPARSDAREVVHFILWTIMQPAARDVVRTAYYMRSSNTPVMEALLEADFQLKVEEYLMVLDLSSQGGVQK